MTQPPCTYPGCDQPTQNWLCNTCVEELQTDIDQIPDLIPVLQLIMRGEEKAFALPTARGTTPNGPGEPINLSALSLLQNFALIQPATDYAQHQDGARSKEQIHAWVRNATLMVRGEPETRETEEYNKLRVKAIGLEAEKKPQEVVDYLHDHAGITDLTADTIRQWKRRGNITAYTIKEVWLHYDKKRKNVV